MRTESKKSGARRMLLLSSPPGAFSLSLPLFVGPGVCLHCEAAEEREQSLVNVLGERWPLEPLGMWASAFVTGSARICESP